MKSGKRFISLALLGALALSLSLVAILPVFSDTGALRFYDPSDVEKNQTWARQGAQVGIELTDPRPVRDKGRHRKTRERPRRNPPTTAMIAPRPKR